MGKEKGKGSGMIAMALLGVKSRATCGEMVAMVYYSWKDESTV